MRTIRDARRRTDAAAAAAITILATAAAAAAQTPVRPALPQPSASALEPGLAVRYAFPAEVRFLGHAVAALRREGEPGRPLVGLDYPDQGLGQPTLTSGRGEFVAAEIEGFVEFDQPGTWRLEIHSNDGVSVDIGGSAVDSFDGRRTCDTNGWVEIEVPEAGWYPVEVLFFQRYNSSCLMMRWEKPDGTREWTPQSAWAYLPE
ncbi:MAG TPA: hypothetical protein VJ994_14005 [Paracoccaceae bacterium]|nr:hypothetical protein [Paracoccaceae bacterium]